MPKHFIESDARAIPLTPVTADDYDRWLKLQSHLVKTWLEQTSFKARDGEIAFIPSSNGELAQVILGKSSDSSWAYATAANRLPTGSYYLDGEADETSAAYCWALAGYAYTTYKSQPEEATPRMVWPQTADRPWLTAVIKATYLVRDLINTPAGDLGPAELGDVATDLFRRHGGDAEISVGSDLLDNNYPLIYAVGKASEQAPRLIDLRWQHPDAVRKITLVGKGVCFDTGGLDIKSDSNMLLMKKDMGGAAHVLGLAKIIMMMNLPVDLRVLIPAVENSVSGNAMHPLDIIRSRKGLSVEIGHTDAEGRLILADALFEACSETPDLVIDCATLTGAARVALGAELPALFCNSDETANKLLAACAETKDPIWRLPLFSPYEKHLKSPVADLNNVGKTSLGGAIIAALFLKNFVDPNIPWIHVDMMAWNSSNSPGRPEGGEAMCLRGLYRFIETELDSPRSA
jgi:leucyl aminopeptidase